MRVWCTHNDSFLGRDKSRFFFFCLCLSLFTHALAKKLIARIDERNDENCFNSHTIKRRTHFIFDRSRNVYNFKLWKVMFIAFGFEIGQSKLPKLKIKKKRRCPECVVWIENHYQTTHKNKKQITKKNKTKESSFFYSIKYNFISNYMRYLCAVQCVILD